MRRRVITSVVVIVGVLFLGVMGFKKLADMRKKSQRSDKGVLAPLVRAEIAKRGDFIETLRGFGRALPLERSIVKAEVAGIVREISDKLEAGTAILAAPAKTGSGATAGDATHLPILIRLDDRDLEDRLERARDDVRAAEAEIELLGTVKGTLREQLAITDDDLATAEREFDRIKPLVPKQLTRSDLDAQRLQVTTRRRAKLLLEAQIKENVEAVKVAEARLDGLRRGVRLAEREFGRAVVRAPFAGRIVERMVGLGESVRVGDPLFTIVNLSRMQVPVALAAGRYDEVHAGAPARVRLPEESALLWEGSVSRVAPNINAEDRTFYAYLVVTGTPTQTPAPPGAHVVAEIEGRTHSDVIAVPRRAFLEDRIFVATPAKDGAEETFVVSERRPTVVRFLSGFALVSDGLEDGERFLVTNLESVAEGSVVRLLTADEPEKAKQPNGDTK